MDQLLLKSGGWFALAVIAFLASLMAVDSGFAVHMGIVCAAALLIAVVTIGGADYASIARGLVKMPTDQGKYD